MDGVVRATQVLAVQTGMDAAFVPPSAAESVDGNRIRIVIRRILNPMVGHTIR